MRLKALLVLAISLYALPAFASPILSIQPATKAVTAGQTFSLDIFVASAVDLYAFEFDLGFNPAVLAAVDITEGPFLGTGGATFFIPGTIDNVGGTIAFTGDSLLTAISGVNGSGAVATARFTALGPGTSPINLFNVTLLDSSLSGISTTIGNGTVNVTGTTPVPEPSALVLLSSGLAAAWRYRRRSTAPLRHSSR